MFLSVGNPRETQMKFLTIAVVGLSLCLTLAATSFAQQIDLIFSHKYHAEDVGASCTDCHAAADTSMLASHNLLPDMDACYKCHDTETTCTVCHKDPDNATAYPRITSYIAHFPHAKHVAENVECTTCHANVAASENILDKHLPPMSACVTCHAQTEKADYCYSCHAQQENLRPANHQLDWTKAHGIKSQTATDCKLCHTDNRCLACHQQDNLDRQVHPLNFRLTHALKAKGDKENCNTCHEETSFCISCHRQELVYPRTHASAGWANRKTGGRHARAAAQDLDSCLGCHSDQTGDPICMQCHQAK